MIPFRNSSPLLLAALLGLFSTAYLTAQDADELRPVRGLIPPPIWEQLGFWITITVVIVLIIIVIALLLKPKKTKQVKHPSAYELALRDLEHAQKLMNRKEDKEFSIAISNTVRHYIERTYHVAAPEQTTEEFLIAAANHPRLSGEPLQKLSAFLQLCDMAKFAKQTFGEAQRQEQYQSAFQFIEKSHEEEMNKTSTTPAPHSSLATAHP